MRTLRLAGSTPREVRSSVELGEVLLRETGGD
jgi:hypothetical protein